MAEAPAPVARPRGLWVLCQGSQRVLDDAARIPRLLEDAAALGATDLFVQVYRGGRAWFDSNVADATPWRAARERSGGVDPLAELLAQAQAAGLRVHAWVNVLSLSQNRDAPMHRRDLGRDVVARRPGKGRSRARLPGTSTMPRARSPSTYRMGTPGLWISIPGLPAWRRAISSRRLRRAARARYPALDGLHLDYIRYPDVLPFSPGLALRGRPGLRLRRADPRSLPRRRPDKVAPRSAHQRRSNAGRWDAWRRDQGERPGGRSIADARAGHTALAWRCRRRSGRFADRAYLSDRVRTGAPGSRRALHRPRRAR